MTAEANGWAKFISMQNHYNLVYREEEREMNPYCLSTGVDLTPWSPWLGVFWRLYRVIQRWQYDRSKGQDRQRTEGLYHGDHVFRLPSRLEIAAKYDKRRRDRGGCSTSLV